MRLRPALKTWLCAAWLALSASLFAGSSAAQDATWIDPPTVFVSPGVADFNADANWSPATMPAATAFFGATAIADLETTADAALAGFMFTPGASDYTLVNYDVLEFTGAGIVVNGGSLSLTNESTVLFWGTSGAGSATIVNNCCLMFFDASSAGSATITNNGNIEFQGSSTAAGATFFNFGVIVFSGSSTAGAANITNDGGLIFLDTSSAGSATIANFSTILFMGSSSAGSATIVNDCCVLFLDTSSAGSARITNNGNLEFDDSSTAANATIINNAALTFFGSSTAGNATILNTCCLLFFDSSSAGSASIVNSGNMEFFDSSTAARATIINTAALTFLDTSTAGRATIINSGNVEFRDATTANGATLANAPSGSLLFLDASRAINTTIVNSGNVEFRDATIADGATITNFAPGTLLFLGASQAINSTIANNGTVVFRDTAAADGVTITSSGLLAFRGFSTLADATIVTQNSGRTLLLDNASGGNTRFVIDAGGRLDFSGLTTAGTTAGSIEGGGDILLGNTQLVAGSLNADTTFAGVISGPGGSFVKVGSGVLTLSGASTYSGPTTVDGGILVVNGSLVSDVTVNGGASLMGSGQVGALAIMSGAVHAPGTSIGTQTINGNYVNAGTLQIEVNASGQSDRLIVNGGINITGAVLQIMEQPGLFWGPSHQYVIVQNDGAGAVAGNFASITNMLAFLTPSVITTGGDGNDIVLTLTRNTLPFSGVAWTPNQRAAASALEDGFTAEPGSDGAVVINALLALSAQGARAAFDRISGEIHASLAHVYFGQSRQLSSLASERLWDAAPAGGASSPAAAAMALGLAPGEAHERMALGAAAQEGEPRASRLGTWVRGYGTIASIDEDGNAARLESHTGGVVVGGDVPLAPGIVAGVMGGWGSSTADVEQRASQAEIDSGHVAAYARAAFGDVLVKALASYSHHDIDVARHIAFGGLSRTARSSYGADQATLYGEAGWRWRLGSIGVMPLAALRWSHASVDGFVEDGAGVLDLTSTGAAYDMLDAIAGVRIATTVAAGGLIWVPQARLAWTRSFGDVDPRLALGLSGGGNFVVSGVVRDRDTLTLGAGLNVFGGEAVSGFVDYAAHLSGDSSEQALTAGLRVRF